MGNQQQILTELHYLPNIQYLQALVASDKVWIECWEHYHKGSYRNRAHIVGGNGLQRLSIPLIKGKNQQQNIRDIRISWHENWMKQHWKSIASAYGKSPFFEYYVDDLRPLYEKKVDFLFDFNWQLLEVLIELIGVDVKLEETTLYEKEPSNGVLDQRGLISPKKESVTSIRYTQVFEERHGFVENLSVIDLLFCLGPEAAELL